MEHSKDTFLDQLERLRSSVKQLQAGNPSGRLPSDVARSINGKVKEIEALLEEECGEEPAGGPIGRDFRDHLFQHLTGSVSEIAVAFGKNGCQQFSPSTKCFIPGIQVGDSLESVLRRLLSGLDGVLLGPEGGVGWFHQQLRLFDRLDFTTNLADDTECVRSLKCSAVKGVVEGQEVVTIVGVDQTDLHEIRQEVDLSREFHRSLVNSIPDRFLITDKNHCVVMCNEFFAETVGLSQCEIIGRPVSRVLPHRLAQQLQQQSESVLENSVCNRWETCWDDPAVNVGHLSIRQSLFTDLVSGEKFVVSSAEDTNQFVRNQMRLNMLASAYKSGGEGIVVLDSVGRLLDANPAFLDLTGWSSETLRNRLFSQLFRPDQNLKSLDQLFSVQQESAKNVSGWTDTLQLETSSNSCVSSRVTINPVYSPVGEMAGWVAIVADLSDVYAASQRLQYQAFHDPLTGLASRTYLNERLAELFGDSETKQFALFFLDLDDFKQVNDTAGHNAGDCLLQEVGTRLRKCLPEDCLISRFGGDEFAILVPDTFQPTNDPSALGKKIVREISKPFEVMQTVQKIGVSVGVSLYPQHGSDTKTLMRNADFAMYRAKSEGKNQFRFYSHSQNADVAERMNLASELRMAIEERSLKLDLQQYQLLDRSFRCTHRLSLVWDRETAGVSAAELAEESRLAVPLGDYLLDVAGQYLEMEGQGAAKSSLPVAAAVRLSQRMLRPDLIGKIQCLLDRYRFDPWQLEILIPEQFITQQSRFVQSIIQQVAELKVQLTVENFGIGHSSISFLKTWGINAVSVDPRFVRNLPLDRSAKEIVDTIMTLAKRHQVDVFAQGVRDQQQVELLKDAGCKRVSWFQSDCWG